jgi:prolyl-tRNA editing enzyme YbaK/EbsC (Cys-tRNA(Pro) deacylase)
VTAFGLPDGVPLWVDSRVMERPLVILGGGNRSTKLKITPAELAKARGIEVVEGLALEPEPR